MLIGQVSTQPARKRDLRLVRAKPEAGGTICTMLVRWVLIGIGALMGLLALWAVGSLCYLRWLAHRLPPEALLTYFSDLNKEERTPR
jgi:hypothetical protein